MENLDYSIIAQLQENGRRPFTEIARSLGVTEGTVRKRVSRLLDEGLVRIVGRVDPLQVGLNAPAIVHINVAPAELDGAAKAIASFPEVSYLLMVAGEYDLLVEVRCRDREHYAQFIREKLTQVPGVIRTVSAMILQTYKTQETSVRTVLVD